MKNGQTTLIPGKSGFPPRVELGADDRVVEVFVGPVWIRISVPDPGNSYDVIIASQGTIEPMPDAERPNWGQFLVKPTPAAINDYIRGY